MYLRSERLISRIQEIAAEAERRSQRLIGYEEMIALPYFGQMILRFTLEAESVSLSELDRYEKLLYDIVGDEFLVDFIGDVYRKVGVDLAAAEARFAKMAVQYADEHIPPSAHGAGIREDAAFLLERAGLPPDEKVWEIQPNGDELLLLVFGKSNTPRKDVEGENRLFVDAVEEAPCVGLLKAALYAKRNSVSLARLLL